MSERDDVLASAVPSLAAALTKVRQQLAEAEAAQAVFTVDTRWLAGTRIEASARSFTWAVDEPPQLGGADEGPNPVELLLASLGACQGIVYSAFSALLNIPLTNLTIRVEGRLDPRGFLDVAKVPVGVTAIHYAVDVDSPAADEDIRKLHDLVESHCPVLATLKEAPIITTELTRGGVPLA